MEDSNSVTISGITAERALSIVHELRTKNVEFQWQFTPARRPHWSRSATFSFVEEKYTAWFELKYK